MTSLSVYMLKLPARFLVAMSFIVYFLLVILCPLVPNYDLQPVGDIRTFLPDLGGGLLYALLLSLLFALYHLLYRQAREDWEVSIAEAISITCLFGLPLLFLYPINANDVYRYVIRGLLSSQLGANPFTIPPAGLDSQLYSALAGEWASATSPYGPLWELMASYLTAIRQELLINVLMFKLLGLLSLITAGLCLWKIFQFRTAEESVMRHRRAAFTILWLWNPALLLSFVGNAHNDAVMIAVLLAGWLLVNTGYHGPGLVVFLAAALVKPVALLVLPIAFIYCLKENAGPRSRIVLVLWLVVGGGILLGLAFLPFGSPVALLNRLMNEASAGASFSLITLLILLVREANLSISFGDIARIALALFTIAYLWLLWRTWQRKSAEQNFAFAFGGYIMQALNFRIWYATWPFPWLLLSAYHREPGAFYWLRAGWWFLVTTQMSVILYGHLRHWLMGGSALLAHLVGIPFVFLLPLLMAWLRLPRALADSSA